MYTLGEAAAILRVSRATLDKWLHRLGIEPQRHPLDYRYFTITPEDVEHIRDTLSERPGTPKAFYGPVARSKPNLTTQASSGSISPATPRRLSESPLSASISASQERLRDNPLPDGWIAVSTFCRRHAINLRSVERHPDMPVAIHAPEGMPWGSRGVKSALYYEVHKAYRIEDLGAAVAAAASIWPRRFTRCEDLTCPCQVKQS